MNDGHSLATELLGQLVAEDAEADLAEGRVGLTWPAIFTSVSSECAGCPFTYLPLCSRI